MPAAMLKLKEPGLYTADAVSTDKSNDMFYAAAVAAAQCVADATRAD